MGMRYLATAALFLAATVHAQSPNGNAVERGKTQSAACQAAGLRAASIAQGAGMARGLEIAQQRSAGRSPKVSLSPCVCQEKVEATNRSWTCSRKWTLGAKP
jgi:hypothetical protein